MVSYCTKQHMPGGTAVNAALQQSGARTKKTNTSNIGRIHPNRQNTTIYIPFFPLRESKESRTFFLKKDKFCLVEQRKFMEMQDHYKLNDYWCMKYKWLESGKQSSKTGKICHSPGTLHLELFENLGFFSVQNAVSHKMSNLFSEQRQTQGPIHAASAFPWWKIIQTQLSSSLTSYAWNPRMPSAALHLHLRLNCAPGKL